MLETYLCTAIIYEGSGWGCFDLVSFSLASTEEKGKVKIANLVHVKSKKNKSGFERNSLLDKQKKCVHNQYKKIENVYIAVIYVYFIR